MRFRYASTVLCLVIAAGASMAWAEVDNERERDVTFDRLLSFVFFEDDVAYTDPKTFFCSNIALPGENDACDATFRVVDANSCKIEVTREFRATWSDGKGREFMRARETFTVANLNLDLTQADYDQVNHTTRAEFESSVDIYRHEGYQFAYDLDGKGQYKACRIDGQTLDIPEQDCVLKGAKPASASKKMTLLFSQDGYKKAMSAVKYLQTKYCPAGGNKL